MSKLFNRASQSVRRMAAREFRRSPVGKLTREARRLASGRGSERRMERMLKTLGSDEYQKHAQQVEQHGGVVKYAANEAVRTGVQSMLKSLGPVGGLLGNLLGMRKGMRETDQQVQAAIDFLRSLGTETITKDRKSPHFERGVAAAKELLSEIATPPPLPGERSGTSPGTGDRKPAAEEEEWPDEHDIEIIDDEWPAEHGIQLLGRGDMSYDAPGQRRLIEKEIRTPGSSNVWSFVFETESRRTGILYVTFKAWTPGGGKRNAPGPTYAYYDIPVKKYHEFKRAAASSAGSAVWDYLRVRGSVWDHQHQYRIVAGTLVQGEGEYVPRKATRGPDGSRGAYRTRTVAAFGVGRRGASRSSLPAQVLAGTPNRGTPDRGTPDRGRA